MQEQQQFWEQRKGTRLETLSVVASPSWLILAQQLQCSVQAISIGCCRKTTCKQGASCLLEAFSSTAASCVLTAQHARVQVLQIAVFVWQELHQIGVAVWSCTRCVVLAWACWSGVVKVLCQCEALEQISFPAVLSYMACSGWCGDGLSLLSSTVTTLERDSPRVNKAFWDGKTHERFYRVRVFHRILVFKMVAELSPWWNTEAIYQIWRKGWWGSLCSATECSGPATEM